MIFIPTLYTKWCYYNSLSNIFNYHIRKQKEKGRREFIDVKTFSSISLAHVFSLLCFCFLASNFFLWYLSAKFWTIFW